MRIFNTTKELLSEAKRDLFEMWKIIKTYSMQNKIVIDDENFQTHELQNYQFLLNDIDNLKDAFNYKEFIYAELQRIFEYLDTKEDVKKYSEEYANLFENIKNELTDKINEYNLFNVVTYITKEDYELATKENIEDIFDSIILHYYEMYKNSWKEFKEFVKDLKDSDYNDIYVAIASFLEFWSLFDFQERIDKSGTINPGIAYKLRPWVWEKFIEKEWKFWYTYNERIVWKDQKLYKLIEEIKKHPTSRQLNLPLFDYHVDYDSFGWGSRIPCSLFYHIMIRPTWERKSRKDMTHQENAKYQELWNKDEFEISISYTMRSCDYLTHFAIDYVQAINLLKFIKDQVKDSIDLKLGTLFYSSCSFHAYKKDLVDHVF